MTTSFRWFSALAAVMLIAHGVNTFAADGQMGKKVEALKARFASADANHDGQLTRDEAKGKMPAVYKNFDQIDLKHQGYVTLEDIEAYAAAKMMDRKKSGSAN
jgi:Ca2+-binding EF-hand superfamily protein